MAYVMAHGFSAASLVINRTQKPFKPLLYETWEL